MAELSEKPPFPRTKQRRDALGVIRRRHRAQRARQVEDLRICMELAPMLYRSACEMGIDLYDHHGLN